MEENQLGMVSDTSVVEKAIQDVLSEQATSVSEYRTGNKKAFNFLVGQVMKRLAGKADPSMVNNLLIKFLEEN